MKSYAQSEPSLPAGPGLAYNPAVILKKTETMKWWKVGMMGV